MRKILDYIDKLREEPESVRRRVLLLTSGGITLVIFLFWLLNFQFIGPDMNRATEQVKAAKDQTAAANLSDAFGRLKNGWQVLVERLKI